MFQTSTISALFRDLEEDPLFGDEVPTDSRPPNSDWFSLSPPQSPDHPKNDGKTEVHKIVNRWANNSSYSGGWEGLQVADNVQLTFCCSFLCLVPDEAKSSYQVEGTGYDTYLRDAHRQVSASAQLQQKAFFFWRFSVWVNDSFQFKDYCGVCLHWDWRGSPKPLEKCNLDLPFFEGHFLKVLFDRMGRILDQVSLKCPAHSWHISHTTNLFCAYWHSNTCLFTITLIWVVWLYSSCIIDVLLCPAALWCEPAGDGCSVQTVFVAPPSLERVPPGSLYQLGPRLQVSLLRHCQGKSLLSVMQLLSDPLLIGVISIL